MSFYIIINLFLALAWAALLGSFSPQNLLFGYLLGFLVLFLSRRALPQSKYFEKVPKGVVFFLFFLWELLKASIRVAIDVLSPKHHMRPRVIAYKMKANTQAEIVLLSNLLTLTPGSLSLDVSSDHTVLYVHSIYAEDEEKAISGLQQLEDKLLDLLR
ncbi:MAG: Na+/H+ antiporter subunit E [Anaerolineae bacterium]|nr:Na+/H+ antiporter subunit E [Anaerolineae bacterium]